jgi:hypothetical protein
MIKFLRDRKIKKILKQSLNNNSEKIYQFIADLKALDVSYIQTVGFLRKRLNIELGVAQEIVINSPSWINEKERIIEFNNKMWDCLTDSADIVEEGDNGQVRLTFDLTKDNKI